MTSTIYSEDSPVGFDFQVLIIQNQLSLLNLIEAIYPISHLQVELRTDAVTEDNYLIPDYGKKGTMKHERWFPCTNNKVDLTFDDSYVSRVFFIAKDNINTNPEGDQWGFPEGSPEINQKFSILLHCSLEKIKNLNIGISNQEQIKTLIISSLIKVPKLMVTSMSENITNIWKEYSMTPEINGFGLFPFYCLRLECEINYYPLGVNGSQLNSLPRYVVSWITSKIMVIIVEGTPNPNNVQVLNNGESIPIEYNLNSDLKTITIPYLNSVSGINILAYFALNGRFYAQSSFFIGGKIDIRQHGQLRVGDTLYFDANIPIWNTNLNF